MSTSASWLSSVSSTPMLPAGRHTFPDVAFHSRMRPSLPAEDRTVPVMFHSTLPTADLVAKPASASAPANHNQNEQKQRTHLWLSKSATMLALHFPSPSPSSASSSTGFTFQILTCPSRLPVAMRWYERPHDGAHATEVTAYTPTVDSVSPPAAALGAAAAAGTRSCEDSSVGAGSRTRMAVGRREEDSEMICAIL